MVCDNKLCDGDDDDEFGATLGNATPKLANADAASNTLDLRSFVLSDDSSPRWIPSVAL